MDGRSCAILETVLNEALLYSIGRGEKAISRSSFMDAYFAQVVAPPLAEDHVEDRTPDDGERRMIAVHEAGHAVVHEVLSDRSVALATAFRSRDQRGGVCLVRKPPECPASLWRRVATYAKLGGRAACDIVFGVADEGSRDDLVCARTGIAREITSGTVFGLTCSTKNARSHGSADREEIDLLASAELERRYQKVKELLASNRCFLQALSDAVYENDYLVSSDIQEIKEGLEVASVHI